MRCQEVTHERLVEVLRYDPVSGNFYWRVATSRRVKVGAIAGCVQARDGYVVIRIDGILYLAHRLARFYVTGEWPVNEIDHIRGTEGGNGWNNLRAATSAENSRNKKRTISNHSGFKGVRKHPLSKGWYAQIGANGKNRHLGTFATPEAAYAAYVAAAAVLHGEFARAA